MLKKLWAAEPVAILAAVNAIIALAVGFGLNLSTEQQGLIFAAASAILGIFARSQVYAPDTVEALTQSKPPSPEA